MINDTIKKLMPIIQHTPVDWDAFDSVLREVEDINYADEEYDETLLTEFLSEGFFFKNGALMPEATCHILENGYDVHAHNGFNGEAALTRLCWTSYDRFILDTAKVLLDAGAPTDYKTEDEVSEEEDPEEELSSVLDNISWKLAGAWNVDNDPEWANVLTAYYYMIKAAEAGKDYHLISSYLDCIGKKLTNVSAVSSSEQGPVFCKNGSNYFKEPLVFWFGDIPMVVKEITEFIVDPLLIGELQDQIVPAGQYFDKIIGSSLAKLQYVNDNTSFLDFDNGCRFLMTSVPIKEKEWKSVYEITDVKMEDLANVAFDEVYRWDCFRYAESTTSYEETALALVKGNDTFFLFTTGKDDNTFHLECIKCSRSLLHEFCLRFPIDNPEKPELFYGRGGIKAMRIKCGEEYFYIKADGYRGLEIALSSQCVDPLERATFSIHFGIHMEFERIEMEQY